MSAKRLYFRHTFCFRRCCASRLLFDSFFQKCYTRRLFYGIVFQKCMSVRPFCSSSYVLLFKTVAQVYCLSIPYFENVTHIYIYIYTYRYIYIYICICIYILFIYLFILYYKVLLLFISKTCSLYPTFTACWGVSALRCKCVAHEGVNLGVRSGCPTGVCPSRGCTMRVFNPGVQSACPARCPSQLSNYIGRLPRRLPSVRNVPNRDSIYSYFSWVYIYIYIYIYIQTKATRWVIRYRV